MGTYTLEPSMFTNVIRPGFASEAIPIGRQLVQTKTATLTDAASGNPKVIDCHNVQVFFLERCEIGHFCPRLRERSVNACKSAVNEQHKLQ